ncbi:MFS transporter [Rhodococcus sp. LB1]|uniref:MFS transporter n=1 Tax=Rhodococcus sp. LB1 TaxID=1807499 RepID=UPI00077A96F6|nr:MFS transporter [Rhodococcus sp. LB1]KXX57497.1 MFS transporter permease [Rhodococcus sp. LB1]
MSVDELGQAIGTRTGRRVSSRQAWIVVALLCGFLIVNYADKIVVGLAGADLMRDMDIDAQQFGIIQSSFFWCFAAGSILGSFLIGRVKAKYLLAGTAVLWVLSLLPMVWSESYEVLIASRMMLGFAEGPATAMAVAVAHTWFSADRRTIPTSVIVAGAGLGPVIAAPVLTMVIVNQSWHAAFAVLVVAGLVWVPLWLQFGREGGVLDARTVDEAVGEARMSWSSILRNRTVLGVAVLMFATYCSSAIKISWLPLYLHNGLGYDKETAGTLVALPYAATAILVVAAGVASRMMTKRGVANRMSRGVLPSLMLASAGVSTVGFALLDRGLLNLVFIIFGASLAGAAAGITLTAVSDVVAARQRGAVLGFIVAVYSSAGVISPLVLGSIVTSAATPAAGYRDGFLILGGVMVVGAIISILLINPDRDSATNSR